MMDEQISNETIKLSYKKYGWKLIVAGIVSIGGFCFLTLPELLWPSFYHFRFDYGWQLFIFTYGMSLPFILIASGCAFHLLSRMSTDSKFILRAYRIGSKFLVLSVVSAFLMDIDDNFDLLRSGGQGGLLLIPLLFLFFIPFAFSLMILICGLLFDKKTWPVLFLFIGITFAGIFIDIALLNLGKNRHNDPQFRAIQQAKEKEKTCSLHPEFRICQ